MLIRTLFLGICLLLSLPSWAQQARGAGKVTARTPEGAMLNLYDNSWAVIIGINEYQKWPSLQYAVNDARAVRDKLISLGFPTENITYLTDGRATKDRIEAVLGDDLRRRMEKNDRVFIYFAGHGQTENLPGGNQEGYIIPVDGDKVKLFSTCISMTSVRQFSQRMPAKHVFYAIDACYSGLALMRAGELDPQDRQYLNKVARFPSRQLVTAGSAGEQVIERGGHGAFTSALLIALDGSADKFPPFGVLTGSELGNYLKPVVSVETNNNQTPQFGRLAAGEGEFMFVLPDIGSNPQPTATRPGTAISPFSNRIQELQSQLKADGDKAAKLAQEAASQSSLGRLFYNPEREREDLAAKIAEAEGELKELQEKEFTYAKGLLGTNPKRGAGMLSAFVASYPESELADDALWAIIGEGGASAEADAYLQLKSFYPESPYVGQYDALLARRREEADRQAFVDAKNSGTKISLQGYLDQYPSGTYTSQARGLLDELKQEEQERRRRKEAAALKAHRRAEADRQAFTDAKGQGTIASLQRYLVRHPSGLYTDQAQELVSKLKRAEEAERLRREAAKGMVHVSDYGFHIDKYEVTNAQYAAFLNAKGNQAEGGVTWLGADSEYVLIKEQGRRFTPKQGYGDHPVIEVSWYGAQAYCAWAGKRLPTEEEWQQACQGRDGRKYPWGASFGSGNANIFGSGDGYGRTAPVGSFPSGASPYGAMDMSGNVWEWTASSSGGERVLRGGSWLLNASYAQCGFRSVDNPEFRFNSNGFRCAR
jgi:hypothetical protein